MSTKRSFNSHDGFRCLAWLSQAYPDIFKEFIAVYDVYDKANEPDDDEYVVESEG